MPWVLQVLIGLVGCSEMDIRREMLPEKYTYIINQCHNDDEVVIKVKEVTDEASAKVS